ncbi:MAG: SRPBCC domain-containing protein [Pseudomonadota bacterium]
MTIEPAQLASLTIQITIDATREKVWTSLTRDIDQWWPADFYNGGDEGTRSFSLETEPGGRMYEQWDDGGGVLWGHVVSIVPNQQLQILGSVFPNFGGPTQWFGTWKLDEHNGQTTLTYTESDIGRVSDKGTDEKDQGWRYLFGCLQAFVEGRKAPTWG